MFAMAQSPIQMHDINELNLECLSLYREIILDGKEINLYLWNSFLQKIDAIILHTSECRPSDLKRLTLLSTLYVVRHKSSYFERGLILDNM